MMLPGWYDIPPFIPFKKVTAYFQGIRFELVRVVSRVFCNSRGMVNYQNFLCRVLCATCLWLFSSAMIRSFIQSYRPSDLALSFSNCSNKLNSPGDSHISKSCRSLSTAWVTRCTRYKSWPMMGLINGNCICSPILGNSERRA